MKKITKNQGFVEFIFVKIEEHGTTFADAIFDRLVHNSIRIELTGETMRKKKKPLQALKAEQ